MTKRENDTQQEGFDISPELEKLRTQNPFRIPQNYFEHLPIDIQNRKRNSSFARSSVLTFVSGRVVGYAAGVAICVCVFVAGLFLLENSGNQSYMASDTELFYDDYLNWYSDYQQVDVYEFILAENIWYDDVKDDEDIQLYEYLFGYSFYDYLFFDDSSE